MISIEVEADNAPPFYLLACFPTVNAYNRLRMHRAVVINWLVLFDFVRHYGKSFRNGSGSFRPNFLEFRIVPEFRWTDIATSNICISTVVLWLILWWFFKIKLPFLIRISSMLIKIVYEETRSVTTKRNFCKEKIIRLRNDGISRFDQSDGSGVRTTFPRKFTKEGNRAFERRLLKLHEPLPRFTLSYLHFRLRRQ